MIHLPNCVQKIQRQATYEGARTRAHTSCSRVAPAPVFPTHPRTAEKYQSNPPVPQIPHIAQSQLPSHLLQTNSLLVHHFHLEIPLE